MEHFIKSLVIAILLSSGEAVVLAQARPVGDEVTLSEGGGYLRTAAGGEGEFVILWERGLFKPRLEFQRMSKTGQPLGPIEEIARDDVNTADEHDVAKNEFGEFVFVWTAFNDSIAGQHFDIRARKGPGFRISNFTDPREPRVVLSDARAARVVFTDGPVILQTVNPAGQLGDFWSSANSGEELGISPVIAVDVEGNSIVAWENPATHTIRAQRLSPTLVELGDTIEVSDPAFEAAKPALTALHGGGFALVWESLGSFGTDVDGLSVQGRFFDPEGLPTGPPFQINQSTQGDQRVTSIDTIGDGSLVVTWLSEPPTAPKFVGSRQLTAAGRPLTPEHRVNQTDDDPFSVDVAATDRGFFVSWSVGAPRSRRFAFPRDITLSTLDACPGVVTFTVSGATPNGRVGLAWSRETGPGTISSGGCARTELELATPRLFVADTADENGLLEQVFEFEVDDCGIILQAVDIDSCSASEVVELP